MAVTLDIDTLIRGKMTLIRILFSDVYKEIPTSVYIGTYNRLSDPVGRYLEAEYKSCFRIEEFRNRDDIHDLPDCRITRYLRHVAPYSQFFDPSLKWTEYWNNMDLRSATILTVGKNYLLPVYVVTKMIMDGRFRTIDDIAYAGVFCLFYPLYQIFLPIDKADWVDDLRDFWSEYTRRFMRILGR